MNKLTYITRNNERLSSVGKYCLLISFLAWGIMTLINFDQGIHISQQIAVAVFVLYFGIGSESNSILFDGENLISLNNFRFKKKITRISLKDCKEVVFKFPRKHRTKPSVIFVLEHSAIERPYTSDLEAVRRICLILEEFHIPMKFVGDGASLKSVREVIDRFKNR